MIVDTSAYVISLILVLIGCIIRDFIIPIFVWKKHLEDKSYGYRFWFCVITQATIQINLVLILGIFNIFNTYSFILLNLLLYLLIIWNFSDKQFFRHQKRKMKELWDAYKENRLARYISQSLLSYVKKTARAISQLAIFDYIKKNWIEIILLIGILIYNIWFLTYNVMQYHSYQFSDIPVHQSWIYEMEHGKVYSDGIYPFGMHIMIYFVRIIFRIELREILIYAGAYQFLILIIGVYLLSKKIFSGKYIPIGAILITSLMLNQGRYAASLPQEAGMYAVIAVAYFMIDYLHKKKERHIIETDSKIQRLFRINSYINRRYISPETILLALSVSLVISYHYFTAIATVFILIALGIAYVPRILRKQYFIPLMFCGIMGAMLAIVPMGIYLMKGVPFQESIDWATTVMSGEEWHGSDADYQDELSLALGQEKDDGLEINNEILPEEADSVNYSEMTKEEIIKYYYKSIYNFNTINMFGSLQTELMFLSIIIGLIFAIIMLLFKKTRSISYAYIAMILIMIFFSTLGASKELGIPEVIAASRASTFAQPFIGIIYMLPIDFLFRLIGIWKNKYHQFVLASLSLALCGFMAFYIIDQGWHHNYFDINQAYYNEPVYVLRKIKKSFDKYSYTIVATTDEYYEVIDHGRHTEIAKFVNMISKNEDEFYFTTDYVFFFIEKVLLQDYNHGKVNVSLEYAQNDFAYMGDIQDYYFQRAVIQSRAYYWAKAFHKAYPKNFKIYFENDIYIVYLMEQNTYSPYNLQIDYLDEYKDLIEVNKIK